MLTLTNRIDMRPGAVPLVIHLGQYDSDFSLVFELYSSAGNFTVESGTTAMIRGTKTDGNAYDADATIDVSAKTVTVAGSEQMTAAKGRNVYELVLKKGTKVLSTANFILDVERAAMDADTIASESVLKELNAIIAGAETATEAAADAASAADRAEDAAESVSSASAQIATNTADISDLKADFEQLEPGLSAEAKAALLACFAKVAWVDEHGQDYYDMLEATLLNDNYPKIEATFNAGSRKIYNVYSADDVKQYISVTYYETYDSEGVPVAQNDFIVSGTLTAGDCVLRVEYQSMRTGVAISGVIDFYNVHHWNSSSDSDVIDVIDRQLLISTSYSEGDTATTPSVENVTSAIRKSMWFTVGDDKVFYSRAVGSNYYVTEMSPYALIPVPEDATGISVAITPATYKFTFSWRGGKKEGKEAWYPYVGNTGWQTGSYTASEIPTHAEHGRAKFICMQTQGVSGNFSQGEPVFDITFTTE